MNHPPPFSHIVLPILLGLILLFGLSRLAGCSGSAPFGPAVEAWAGGVTS